MKWLCKSIADYTADDFDYAYSVLSPSRKQHIDRMRNPDDRARSLAAELLLRELLCGEYGIADPVIERSENGRPFIAGSELHISISHSIDMVACAVNESEIGIDVEKIKPMNLKLAERVCVDEELLYVFGKVPDESDYTLCDDGDILCRFFEIWTAKEAYFKKCGTGITDMKSVNVLTLNREMFRMDDYIIQTVY